MVFTLRMAFFATAPFSVSYWNASVGLRQTKKLKATHLDGSRNSRVKGGSLKSHLVGLHDSICKCGQTKLTELTRREFGGSRGRHPLRRSRLVCRGEAKALCARERLQTRR